MEQKRVVVYYRKSTDAEGKDQEESVAYQQDKIHQYAMDNDLEIMKEFFDIGVTGSKNDRPELLSMYHYLDESDKEASEVLFYSIERFGRDMSVNIELLQKVVEKVGKATFVRESLSSGAEHFNMMFLIYSGIAENDRNNLKRNLRDGRRAKVLRYGNFDGNSPPLGYAVDPSTKKLIARRDTFSTDELAKQELEIVDVIYRSFLLGKSLRQIAKKLNCSYGLTKRGCEWSYKSVQYILKNPAYIGTLKGVLEGTEHYYREESNVESIIDPVVFSLVQKKLKHTSSGRKRKDLYFSPTIMMCKYCAAILKTEDKKVFCTKCESSETLSQVSNNTSDAVNMILHERLSIGVTEKLREKVILQYRIKDWRMETKLKELLERKKEIRKMDVSSFIKKKMQAENTKHTTNLILESNIAKGIIECFKIQNGKQLEKRFFNNVENLLIQVPFISLVDLIDKKVELMFIPSILAEEHQD